MAISRSEMQDYFEIFDIKVDDDGFRLPCFYCGLDLFYKRSRYSCDNNHRFSYQDLVMEHAEFMAYLTSEVTVGKICNQKI